MKDKSKRQKWVHLRVTEEEYSKLQSGYQVTTFRMFSDFLRAILFHQPINVFYRSRTADDFVSTALKLKAEMTDVGRNFNQVVKKVNSSHATDELGGYLFDL